MRPTREQKRRAYKKLSLEAQDFIMSSETTDLISDYLNKSGIREENIDSADSEILNAMLGLQTISDAIKNIALQNNKNESDFSDLKQNLEDNIFTELGKLKNNINTEINHNEESGDDLKTETKKEFTPNSYEQILINQAKAMRPVGEAPSNLPTEEAGRVEERAIHHSIGYTNSDPYREPAE